MIENFHFLRPACLYLLLPLLVLIVYLYRHTVGSRSWESICDKHLWPHILSGKSKRQKHQPNLLIGCAGLLAILALAGPTWEQIPQPVFDDQSALIIALDLSSSMDASDVRPSRLIRARFKIADILKQRSAGQTALLVYANDAYIVTPLTNDSNTINAQLSALTTDIMPLPGSRLSAALSKATDLLKQAGLSSGDVLVITDGIDEPGSKQTVRKLLQQGYRLSILGVGTKAGAPIPLASGGFLKDQQGAIVIPAYDDSLPRQLAKLGQGVYQAINLLDDTDIQGILQAIESNNSGSQAVISDDQFHTDRWQEQGPWLLLLLLPLAMLAFRRGYVAVIIILLWPMPKPAQAIAWADLWLRADQQAERELQQGDSNAAAEKFLHPEWQAVAHYQAGNFAAAVAALEGLDDPESLYNKGNALGQLGDYQEAINAYRQSLELMPDNEDAQYNLKQLEEALEKQQQNADGEQQGEPSEGSEEQQGEQSQQAQASEEQQGEPSQQAQRDEEQQGEPSQQAQQAADQEESAEGEQGNEQQLAQPSEDEQEGEQEDEQGDRDEAKSNEQMQATEQWLRRIPDDPGGLLKRKFHYHYKRRDARRKPPGQSW